MAPSANLKKRGATTDASNKVVKSGRVTKQPGPQRDWPKYTHIPPNADEISSNGRQTGRNLITWNRPHMAEKLLLHMEYELVRHRVNVPWDNIAHRLNPGSSGAAVTQYLHRLRPNMLAQGHLVPPIPMKPGGPTQDPAVRGHVRKNMHSGDATITRAVPWTEPMYDLKTPHTDSAWALDGLDTQEDSGLQEMHKQSGRKGKKTARPTRLAAAKNVSYAEDQDCDISEDADDEADRTAEEPKDKEDEDKDEGEIDDGASQISHVASKSNVLKPGRPRGKDTDAVETPFGTVTPKRRGGNVNSPFQDMLNGAVLCTPDGRKYGFTDMADLNVGISADPFLTTAQNPMSGSFFTTAASSPGNWDLTNVTPTTRDNMHAHLIEWNVPPPLFAFPSIKNASGLVVDAHASRRSLDLELSRAFVKPEDSQHGLDSQQKHK